MNGPSLNFVNDPQKFTLNRFNYETVPESFSQKAAISKVCGRGLLVPS
jgi:hypothetical protein